MRRFFIGLFLALFLGTSLGAQNPVNSYAFASSVVDLFPPGNAASIGAGEADSTSGWNFVTASGSSVETDSHDGSSSIQLTMSSGGNGRGEYDVTVTNGADYEITFWYRVTGGTGGLPGLVSWTGVVTSPSTFFTEDNTWRQETVTVTANSTTMKMRFYADRGTGTGTRTVLIDEILIQEIP
jgi:hypothetical protein